MTWEVFSVSNSAGWWESMQNIRIFLLVAIAFGGIAFLCFSRRKAARLFDGKLGGAVALLFLTFSGFVLLQNPVHSSTRALPSIHIEELTWTEVQFALDEGYRTVIIPTGGTEQNGPHMILGKHNYIVRETSERIAVELGRTLVAPVMAYVPEGDAGDAPTLHMRRAGTISLPQPVFALTLEYAARSFETHGFTRILFVGDSSGNQMAQATVAEELTREWTAKGVQVLHVGEYYSDNGQGEALTAMGFADQDIGQHAGISDTSELIALKPNGVRSNPVAPPQGMHPAFSGRPELATAKIGEAMLSLKVDAALRQIRRSNTHGY